MSTPFFCKECVFLSTNIRKTTQITHQSATNASKQTYSYEQTLIGSLKRTIK